MEQRHWIDNVADLFSGRIYNTLVSLTKQLGELKNKMTKNQEIINNVAQELAEVSGEFDAGIQALKDEIEGGTASEDLDFSALESIADNLKKKADGLTPAPAGTAGSASTGSTDAGPVATPIDPTDLPPTPLAGASGPTDAGVPTEVQAPGNPNPEPQTTPLADDASAEAGNGPSTEVSEPAPLPETDEGEIGGTVVEDGEHVPAPPTADATELDESPDENPTGEEDTGDSSSSADGTEAGTETSTQASSDTGTGESSPSSPPVHTSEDDEFDD